ncbi:MAG: hypothetical protein ABL953_09440 [Ilumatobacteraceae bacterium]
MHDDEVVRSPRGRFQPGPGWWKASDGNWYPPESAVANQKASPPAGAGSPRRLGRKARKNNQYGDFEALMFAMAFGDAFERFIDLGQMPPAHFWINRFACGHPREWIDETKAYYDRGVSTDVQDLTRRLLSLNEGGLTEAVATERIVTILLTEAALDLSKRLTDANGALVDELWRGDIEDRWFPDMHLGQVAVAEELRRLFRPLDYGLFEMARDGDTNMLTQPSMVLLVALEYLEVQAEVLRLALPEGPQGEV